MKIENLDESKINIFKISGIIPLDLKIIEFTWDPSFKPTTSSKEYFKRWYALSLDGQRNLKRFIKTVFFLNLLKNGGLENVNIDFAHGECFNSSKERIGTIDFSDLENLEENLHLIYQ